MSHMSWKQDLGMGFEGVGGLEGVGWELVGGSLISKIFPQTVMI